MAKFYITTPIYYINDKAHIGHAYTTIAADVLARFHRMRGDDVFFLTGTDEHGSKIAAAAEQAGKSPQEFCDQMSAVFSELWDALNISNNDFIRTTSERHKKGVEKFLLKLKSKGAIYSAEYKGLYCTGCERFMTAKELVDGKCPFHQKRPEKISEKNYFFKLKDYLEEVKKRIVNDEIKILPATAKKETLGLFKQGLKDFSISREKVKWGIKIPFVKNQVVYVWVEALQNYLTGVGYGYNEKKFDRFWPADLHLMARDILKFHAIYWPALLLAADIQPPKTIFAHGFFTINGQKMSKSLGNIIDPNEMIKKFGTDGTRYLLLVQFPFGEEGDIKANKFTELYNAFLANNLGNLVSRVMKLAEKIKNQRLEAKNTGQLEKVVFSSWKNYDKNFINFQIKKALDEIFNLVSNLNVYIDREEPWNLVKTDQKRFDELMLGLLEALRHIGWMLYPFMPETSEKILKQLGVWEKEKTKQLKEIKKWNVNSVKRIKKGKLLFPRV